MRDNAWLENRLEYIWTTYFTDVERINEVKICFGRQALTRLGSIKQARSRLVILGVINHNPSVITITGIFRDEIVPEHVVDLVIAHEMAHYAHGFCSPHPQKYKNPHQGKIIDKELYIRGFGEEIKSHKKWLKEEWPKMVKGLRVKSSKLKVKNPPNKLSDYLKLLLR